MGEKLSYQTITALAFNQAVFREGGGGVGVLTSSNLAIGWGWNIFSRKGGVGLKEGHCLERGGFFTFLKNFHKNKEYQHDFQFVWIFKISF